MAQAHLEGFQGMHSPASKSDEEEVNSAEPVFSRIHQVPDISSYSCLVHALSVPNFS